MVHNYQPDCLVALLAEEEVLETVGFPSDTETVLSDNIELALSFCITSTGGATNIYNKIMHTIIVQTLKHT